MVVYFNSNKEDAVVYVPNQTSNNTDNEIPTNDIEGCYVAGSANDVYTLNVQNLQGQNVLGTLSFKNFQKDSSSGSISGTYNGQVLLADYSFNSEGVASVMQVIFKKSGDSFIRGYGEMNSDGTRFANLNNITYESTPLFTFQKGACTQ